MANTLLPAAGDLAVSLSPDPSNPNGIMFDYALAPGGDIGLVTDMSRVEQDVILRFSIPVGTSPFYPSLGNKMFQQIGRQIVGPDELIEAVADVESQLIAEDAQDAQDGQRSSSATLKRIVAEPPQVNGTQILLRLSVTAADDTVSLITAGV